MARGNKMDLIKELKLAEEKSNAEKVIDDLYDQQCEISQKIHILRVNELAKDVLAFVRSELLKSDEVKGIHLYFYQDNNDSDNRFFFHFEDANEDRLSDKLEKKYFGVRKKFQKLFDSFGFVNLANINEEFSNQQWCDIKLDENIDKAILDLFLSKELKAVLDFSKMQIALESKDSDGVSKRPKL